MKKQTSLPAEIIKGRKMIYKLAKNDFRTKYAGSYLGIIWAFIQPVVTVLVYWFVFEVGFRAGENTLPVPFVLYLIAGIVPWFFFQDGLIGGTNSMLEYSYLVKKVVFQISVLPVVKIISAVFVHLFFVLFIIILYCFYGHFPDLYYLQLFLLYRRTVSAHFRAFLYDQLCCDFFPGSVPDDQHCSADRSLADSDYVGGRG